VEPAEIAKAIRRAFSILSEEYGTPVEADDDVVLYMAGSCGGDVRKAMNSAELCCFSAEEKSGRKHVTMELAEALSQRSSMQYDRAGDQHYDIVSALQKSIRGSDENAALHYLARLLEAGDLISACRRIMVIACEDIGLAYPQAIPIVKACIDAAVQLGLPEGRIPLADAVVLLATAPKSNSAYMGINRAMADVEAGKAGPIPRCLQNKHYDGDDVQVKGQFYKYPHDYPDHYVRQQYLPDNLAGTVYYEFGDNKNEQAAKAYRARLLASLAEREKHEKG